MIDAAGQHIGDGLDAAMRMPREAREIISGALVPEVIEQKEGIEFGRVAKPERAMELDPCPLDGGLGLTHAFDGTDGHGGLLVCDIAPEYWRHSTTKTARRAILGLGLGLAGCDGTTGPLL